MLYAPKAAGVGVGFGVASELRADFRLRGSRTALTDAYFTSPLKLTKTFPVEGADGGVSATVMDVSPGLMDGDDYALTWSIGDGCSVGVTTQSYAKAHPSPRFGAKQTTTIAVGSGASLVYAPQPTMLYADAAFASRTRVELADNATLLLFDTLCAGRVHYGADGEAFRYRSFESDLLVTAQGRVAAASRVRLAPAEQSLQAIGAFEGDTHVGALYAFGPFAGRGAAEAMAVQASALTLGGAGLRCGVSALARYGVAAVASGRSAWAVHEALLRIGRAFAAYADAYAPPACARLAWPLQ
ncbi:urease accessory protein UreD [Paenibacillus sp.]|uniref:urease accessory protein UreD n=1 Tax=Paenibacillus sp. TaxID=58172 RepID=UPI0028123E5F|nr:urease accessory protein UreD [Paenibacillus sp.]